MAHFRGPTFHLMLGWGIGGKESPLRFKKQLFVGPG